MFATADEAEFAFYEALEQGDLNSLMQVWADDEEVACIHPGGIRVLGHMAVRESWQEILANGPLVMRPMRLLALQSMMSSVHSVVEQMTVQSPAGMRVANCYATNVYHKGPAGWKLVLHHASAAPSEAGLLDLHDLPDQLH